MALPQNLRDIEFFILQGCWVPCLVWDLSWPCSCVCGQLWVGQMALLILSGSGHMYGNLLAEGWFRVVFAWITWVTKLCSICPSSSRSPVQTCPHSDGQAQEHEWNRQEAFWASSWNNYTLNGVHCPKAGHMVELSIRNGKRDFTHIEKATESMAKGQGLEKGAKNWGHQHNQPNNHWNIFKHTSIFLYCMFLKKFMR